jgi:radical SAM protein with 4Fe4S-binding SPASM domain
MDIELFYSIIKQLAALNFSGRISFDFYNEPLLNKHIVKYLEIIQQTLTTYEFFLYTNGTLLSKDKFTQLFPYVSSFIITKQEQVKEIPLDRFYSELSSQEKEKIYYRTHDQIIKFNRGGILSNVGGCVKPLTPCYIPLFLISITHNGVVLPCFEDFHLTMPLGDLKSTSLKEVLNSKKLKEMQTDLKRGQRYKYELCKACNRTYDGDPDAKQEKE